MRLGGSLRPELRRKVEGMARKAANGSPGIERDDLIQEAYLHLIRQGKFDAPPREIAVQIAGAMMGLICKERYSRTRTDRIRLVFVDVPDSLASEHAPEPTAGLVDLFAVLTDGQAEAITLACGLDGTVFRSPGEVAHITGADSENTRKQIKVGLAKLRAAIEQRAGGAVAIRD